MNRKILKNVINDPSLKLSSEEKVNQAEPDEHENIDSSTNYLFRNSNECHFYTHHFQ